MKKILAAFLVMTSTSSFAEKTEEFCLAEAIYFEARGESVKGQVAVANVILNRVKDRRWPNTICDVVYQPYQFSYTIDKNRKINDRDSWELATAISNAILNKNFEYEPIKSNHYHAEYINPKWANSMVFLKQIGRHVFFVN